MSPFAGGLARARELLTACFGHRAFRVHQLKVLGPLLAGHSVLAVLPTGAGKSLCYQLPALMTRGLTLVVSPLISLMQNQVAALRRRGIAAAYLNSLLDPHERRAILDAALSGALTLLYCAPERLGSLVLRLTRAGREVSLLAVDEAHCIVEWGNEFRPVYRRLDKYRYLLGDPVTITQQVAVLVEPSCASRTPSSCSRRSTDRTSRSPWNACGTIAPGSRGCARCCADRRGPRSYTPRPGGSPSS